MKMKYFLLFLTAGLLLNGCVQGSTGDEDSSSPKTQTDKGSGKEEGSIDQFDNVKTVASAEEADALLEQDGPLYIYVSQDDCKYCQMVEPAMMKAIEQTPDVTIYHINATNVRVSDEFMAKTNATRTPWLIRWVDGEVESHYLFDENTKGHEISLWLASTVSSSGVFAPSTLIDQ